jgi:hypothetical protein
MEAQITRMENIPSDVIMKKSKAQDEYEKRKEWSLEALASPIHIHVWSNSGHKSVYVLVERWSFEEFMGKIWFKGIKGNELWPFSSHGYKHTTI